MTEAELAALVGHRFPGGTRVIEHWDLNGEQLTVEA